ncbi:two-component system, OmpR family, phosphate regulon sensor histidine kinase PhoR [Gammaproteobacteria bacterium]
MNLWMAFLLRLLLLFTFAVMANLFFGPWTAVGILVAGFILIHGYHLWQLARLRDWLAQQTREEGGSVGTAPLPDALGAWGDAFAALFRLHRAERAAQRYLTTALAHLRKAAEALPEGVVLLDKTMHIEWVNPQSARDLGIDPERDRGTLITHLVRDPEFSTYLAVGGDAIVLHRSGEPARTLSVAVVPFAETGRLLISRDISAIEQANTVRRDFIANVSHELRTPLTVIVGFLENLLDEAHESENAINTTDSTAARARHSALALMSEQVGRMQQLVDDLLTLSRLDEYRIPEYEETVDVPALLAELAKEGIALSAGNHIITANISATVPLRGNPQELRSAFTNLVSNAVRYTLEGGRITLRWKLIGEQPVFEVTDTGVGIAQEHIPRLTERFYRVDKGRSSATGGTGLGLAIVKHVVLRHGARLEIQSELARGSTFRVIFPSERIVRDIAIIDEQIICRPLLLNNRIITIEGE